MNISDWIHERRYVDLPANTTQCEVDFFANTRFHQVTYANLLTHHYPNRPNHRYDLSVGCGIDVLAFYIPFHFHSPPRPWGIYIKEDGVSYLKDKFSQTIDQSIPLSFDGEVMSDVESKMLDWNSVEKVSVDAIFWLFWINFMLLIMHKTTS